MNYKRRAVNGFIGNQLIIEVQKQLGILMIAEREKVEKELAELRNKVKTGLGEDAFDGD